MLPTETFADVVSFLEYYDLGGLKLANKLFSDVANRCADSIRLFDFSDNAFFLRDSGITVHRLSSDGGYGPVVCQLELTSEDEQAKFISEAFRNCTFGRFAWMGHSEYVQQAIKDAAKTIAIANLAVLEDCFENFQGLVGYVDSFRRVKV